jgi:hypothetical protein
MHEVRVLGAIPIQDAAAIAQELLLRITLSLVFEGEMELATTHDSHAAMHEVLGTIYGRVVHAALKWIGDRDCF